MVKCKDSTVSYLASFGFNIIRLPRSDVRPGDVLAGAGPELSYLGHLTDIWKLREPFALEEPAFAAFLSGRKTDKMQVDAGIAILSSLLAPVGVSVPRLKTAFSRTKELAFGFGSPKVWSLTPVLLGQYLTEARLPVGNPVVDSFLAAGKRAHFVTDVLLSASMTVEATVGEETGQTFDVGVLKSAISCDVKLLSSESSTTLVEFVGTEPLGFGFRCIEFEAKDGAVKLRRFTKPGAVFQASPPPPTAWSTIFAPVAVVIHDPGSVP
jgi:hypothetical protein